MRKNLTKIIAMTLAAAIALPLTACGNSNTEREPEQEKIVKTDMKYEVSKELSDSNASENTKRLYSFLCDMYGNKILSGQVCDKGMYGPEITVVSRTTGRYPAILSMDLTDYTPTRPDGGADGKTIDYGVDWWEKGGILEYHWHWTTDDRYIREGKEWYSTFYTDSTTFNLKKALNGSDNYGKAMLLNGIEAIAAQLKVLADKDIPILFRPLHEASGGWFWWGASGPEAYIELYKLMYDQLTNYYGLHNLIWIWNGQSTAWYPGDEYVDIISYDSYPRDPANPSENGQHIYDSQKSIFDTISKSSSKTKMVYMSENSCIFDPDKALQDNAMWGSFITWQGEFITYTGFVKLSEKYTEKDMLIKIYTHENVLTLDELPDITKYSIK